MLSLFPSSMLSFWLDSLVLVTLLYIIMNIQIKHILSSLIDHNILENSNHALYLHKMVSDTYNILSKCVLTERFPGNINFSLSFPIPSIGENVKLFISLACLSAYGCTEDSGLCCQDHLTSNSCFHRRSMPLMHAQEPHVDTLRGVLPSR